MYAYLLFGEIVGEIGDHDFGGGWDTIFRWTTLLGLSRCTDFGVGGRSSLVCVVGNIGQRLWVLDETASLSCSSNTSSTTTTTATCTASSTTATARGSLAFTIDSFSLCLLFGVFWLASELNRDLAFENVLAREVGDGLVGFFR